MKTKLLIVVNEDRFFLSHRTQIALAAQQEGYDVTILCKDTGRSKEVAALGLRMDEFPINPTGTNIRQELRTLWFLFKYFRRHRPDIVHLVGVKNILWGSLAARIVGIKGVLNAVSGLGILFSGEPLSRMAHISMCVMRFANNRDRVIELFQNDDDESLFLQHGVVRPEQCARVNGSGVDLNRYSYVEEPDSGKIRLLFTARMIKEKGVLTIIEAANLLREEMEGRVEFLLCGGLSNNPDGVSEESLHFYTDGRYLQWLGYRNDVHELLNQSHIMVFPSYYREGVPLSLIEAAAVGRPIVTTNSVGCRDVVDEGVNGFLVPPRDAQALADRLRILINDRELRLQMGRASRLKAEQDYSIDNVVAKHLELYRRLK